MQYASTATKSVAVLIDADNAQASVIQELLTEVSRYGTATIKRAYGDWTTTNVKGWKAVQQTMAIQPIQQFSCTSGKNANDSALIIDAMDALHTGSVDGFCLFSSDSDFTRLATRIREAGLVVYCFGERKTRLATQKELTSGGDQLCFYCPQAHLGGIRVSDHYARCWD